MSNFDIAIYADGASVDGMIQAKEQWPVSGFTTNPSLMKKAGVKDYVNFAQDALAAVSGMPLSFEVFSDDFETMEAEATKISALGDNVFVKIPITNTKGESSVPLIEKLSKKGIQVNVTAILTLDQVKEVLPAFQSGTHNIVSVFAGRVADTGVDPMPLMESAVKLVSQCDAAELLWASCREVFNIFQAQSIGVDIITVTNAVLNKLAMVGKDTKELSLETVQGFHSDVKALEFSIL